MLLGIIGPEMFCEDWESFSVIPRFFFFADMRADKPCNRHLAGVLYYSDEEVKLLDA